jgi:lambda repressor-like predicted transcriptional regulator
MPLTQISDKSEPLTPAEIKIILIEKDVSIADLARRWHTTSAVISRIIHRRGEYVYPKERRLLARLLGVEVSRVGREPNRESAKSRYARAA